MSKSDFCSKRSDYNFAYSAAGPFFANSETIVRLDQTDAKYVDVIHSDIDYFVNGGFGLPQKIGHVDFYPNGK